MRAFWALFALLAALHAANLSGSIYSMDSFDAVQGVVVKAEGASTYQAFSTDGTYAMDIPAGEYTVKAFYYPEGKLGGYAEDRIMLGEGGASYDFVLFAPDEFEAVVGFDVPGLDEEIPEQEHDLAPLIFLGAALGVAVVALAYFFMKRKMLEGAVEKIHLEKKKLDEEEKKVLEILGNSEGMRNQKELREIMKCTEAKMSLLVSGLEAQGYVKRIKRGRENIVKLIRNA
ncbi:MAG TPA: hypothetical protein PKJ97_01630, partial [Candidatus Bilamarchaeaceae archaeon]|nr:hypothetical protein [Candidatus Bilamarchaeaceae archaeon]